MYCSNCGKEVIETSKYCSNCGLKIGFLDDQVSRGMRSFNVGQDIKSTEETGIEWGLLFSLILSNIGMFIATFFSSYGVLKACHQLSKEGRIEFPDIMLALLYLVIFIIPTAIWQAINNKMFLWVDDFSTNELSNISFWTYFSIFIPAMPAVIRLYYSTQYENFAISMQNILFYFLAIMSCWVYYWIKNFNWD